VAFSAPIENLARQVSENHYTALLQDLTFESGEQYLGSLRWVSQSLPLPLDRRTDRAGGSAAAKAERCITRYMMETIQPWLHEVAVSRPSA
jgi:hypothetical protein